MYFFRRYGMTILKVAAYLILSASMVVGIWEIVTKAHLPPDDRVKVGFGFAVALPAMLVIWLPLLHSSEVSPKRKWILVLILGVIVASVALGIWSIFRHAQYSTSKKISLSVFLAVFPPCFFSLCAPRLAIGDVFRRREEFDSRIDLCRAVWTFVSLAGIVWALTQKTQLSLADKIIDSFLIITFGGWLIFGLSSCLNDILLDNWHTQSTWKSADLVPLSRDFVRFFAPGFLPSNVPLAAFSALVLQVTILTASFEIWMKWVWRRMDLPNWGIVSAWS